MRRVNPGREGSIIIKAADVPPGRPKTLIDEQLERSAANAERKKFVATKGVMPEHLKRFVPKYGGTTPPRSAVSSRGRLQGKFLTALADDFEQHGKRAIERARIQDPMGYIKAVVALMPKQFEQTSPLQDLSDAELERGIAMLKSRLAVGNGAGDRTAALTLETDGLQTVSETN
jgi:hypothetical protein